MTCPKCSGEMDEGGIVDRRGLTEGSPVWSHWTQNDPIKLSESKIIYSYRCKICGFLENYARGGESSE